MNPILIPIFNPIFNQILKANIEPDIQPNIQPNIEPNFDCPLLNKSFSYTPKNFLPPKNLHAAAVYSAYFSGLESIMWTYKLPSSEPSIPHHSYKTSSLSTQEFSMYFATYSGCWSHVRARCWGTSSLKILLFQILTHNTEMICTAQFRGSLTFISIPQDPL